MRVFAGGILTETNTFAPFPTGMADYVVTRAADFIPGNQTGDYGNAMDVWYAEAQKCGWEVVPGLHAYAQPAGITPCPVYETLRDEMLSDLERALPVDIVLLDLHGAMVAQGYDDCETDMIDRVRRLVGPDVKIGVELDLHCDLTEQMIDQADAIVIYKEYPHTDIAARAKDVFTIVADAALGRIEPVMATFDCRMIGFYMTPFSPMREFVDAMSAREGRDGVLSLSLAHTFPWGDVSSCGVKMLAVTDGDPGLARRTAEAFGRRFFDLRHALEREVLPLPEALDRALAMPAGPVVIADMADNPGGGAPSDSTFALRELLARGVTEAALGMIWDPVAVQVAQAAGEGASLKVRLGGKMCPMSGDPLDIEATVVRLASDRVQEWPQQSGAPISVPMGDAALLHCRGIDIVVNTRRTQVYGPSAFTQMGVDPAQRRIVVVKSTQHFYAGFAPLAAEIIYMAAPGAIAPIFTDIPYRHVDRHKYPWVDDPHAA